MLGALLRIPESAPDEAYMMLCRNSFDLEEGYDWGWGESQHQHIISAQMTHLL